MLIIFVSQIIWPQKNMVMSQMKLGLTGDVDNQNSFPDTKYRIHTNFKWHSTTCTQETQTPRVSNLQHQSR